MQSGEETEWEWDTQEECIVALNKKHNLVDVSCGSDKENAGERRALNIRTVCRNITNGNIGKTALSKGKTLEIPRKFLELVALHSSMSQVSVTGKLNSSQLRAVMEASTIGTVHEDSWNTNFLCMAVSKEHADTMIPVGVQQSDDIRWMWCTFQKINKWCTNFKVSQCNDNYHFNHHSPLVSFLSEHRHRVQLRF